MSEKLLYCSLSFECQCYYVFHFNFSNVNKQLCRRWTFEENNFIEWAISFDEVLFSFHKPLIYRPFNFYSLNSNRQSVIRITYTFFFSFNTYKCPHNFRFNSIKLFFFFEFLKSKLTFSFETLIHSERWTHSETPIFLIQFSLALVHH